MAPAQEGIEDSRDGYYQSVLHTEYGDLFTFYAFPESIQRSIYTTNLIENFNKDLKRGMKAKEQFPDEEALKRYVCSYCMDYNRRYSPRVHRGFVEAQAERLMMFDNYNGHRGLHKLIDTT